MTCTEFCGTLSCVLAWSDDHATALVATAALLFTIYHITVTRRHNELSLKPRLFIWVDSKDLPGGGSIHTIFAKNYGLGPAWIESIEYTVRGRRLDHHNADEVSVAVHEMFPNRNVETVVQFKHFRRRPYAIPKDGQIELIAIRFLEPSGRDLEGLAADASVTIEYTWAYKGKIVDSWPGDVRRTAA